MTDSTKDVIFPDAPVAIRIRLYHGERIAFGPGKAALLTAIDRMGSISAGARAVGMSYRRAWLLVTEMNDCFATPLVETAVGGVRGGGAAVSIAGRRILQRYAQMQRIACEAIANDVAWLASELALPAASSVSVDRLENADE